MTRYHSSFLMRLWLGILSLGCYCCLHCLAQEGDNVAQMLQISGFMDSKDFEFCYNALKQADEDDNLQVFEEEYVEFARSMSPAGLLDGVNDYESLPVAFKAAFLGTACLCLDPAFGGDPNNTECCKGDSAHIIVPESPPSNSMPLQEKLYLYAACSYTDSAAQYALKPTPPPTPKPTLKPTTIAPTTAAPTTPAPVTTAPTVAATQAATTQPPETALPTTRPPAGTTTPVTTVPSTAAVTPAPSKPPVVTTPPATAPPTSSPPPKDTTVRASVNYDILVPNGQENTSEEFVASYRADLEQAMDILAPQIVSEVFSGRRYRQRSLRRLAVTFQSPSEVGALADTDCPDGANSTDLCQNVLHHVNLNLVDEADPDQAVAEFEAALSQAIEDGRLQELLKSPLVVVTSSATSTPRAPPPTDDKLSPGAIAGIVIGALVAVAIPVGYLVHRNQSQKSEGKDYEAYEKDQGELAGEEPNAKEKDGDGLKPMDKSMDDREVYTDDAGATFAPAAAASAAMLGASKADYGRTSRKAVEAMAAGEDIVAEPEMDVAPDSSSNAGSSGWSSSAGISSLNTGSIDDSMDAAAAAGATLAAIGASSTLARKSDEPSTAAKSALSGAESSEGPSEGRSQLDSLIEAGDWAAVGATAALLAAASDSQSQTSRSQASGKSGSRSYTDSLDAARAAELDNLVDAGDWEGVVLAAAKFEAAESSVAESRSTQDSLGTGTHGSGSATRSASGDGTSVSDDPSKAQRRAEVRAEVEALVRRVVPEEIDNVDEMMTQFKGREEELVETLRTMQERSVAQKARSAGQKAAKVEARRSVQRGVVPGVAAADASKTEGASSAVAAAAVSADAASELTSDASTGVKPGSIGTGSMPEGRTALELAIEAGDWEAVGEAAAMMSDASSAASASTGEIGRLGEVSVSSSSVSSRRRTSSEGADAVRTAELDEMIEKGDWTGVVQATKRYKESVKKRSAPSKEEEEALAQAEKWAKIAAEKKAEGAEDAGASDAAEWAIQQSLSKMKQAEEQQQREQQGKTGDSEEDEV